jgi:hypothetical protein
MPFSRRRRTLCGLMAVGCAATLLTACEDLEPCAKGGQGLSETAQAIQEELCLLAADVQALPLRVGGGDVGSDFFLSNNLPVNSDVLLGVTNLPGAPQAAAPVAGVPLAAGLQPTLPDIDVELPDGTSVSVPLDVSVTWTVRAQGRVLEPDRDMAVLGGGLDQPSLQIAIVPPLVGLHDSPTVQAQARPAVRLVADTSAVPNAGTPTVEVTANPPALPLPLDALRVPELLVMFRDKSLSSNVLLVVPNLPGQTKEVEGVREALSALKNAVPTGALEGAVAFAEFAGFLGGVSLLTGRLQEVGVEAAIADDDGRDEIDELNEIDLHLEDLVFDLDTDFNDIEAEDTLSSLAYLGLEGDQVHLFNAQDQDDDEGHLEITLGRLPLAFIGDLHTADPQLDTFNFSPAGVRSDARVVVLHKPDGRRTEHGILIEARKITGFGDEFSSLAFR